MFFRDRVTQKRAAGHSGTAARCKIGFTYSAFHVRSCRLMVETLEPSVVWELPKAQIEELASKYDDIEQLYRKFIEHSLIESQIKADALRFEPAHERYNKLLRLHPEILKRAPLVYIASLLQMTPETLSRVRSSLL